jgi:hypothetical protein
LSSSARSLEFRGFDIALSESFAGSSLARILSFLNDAHNVARFASRCSPPFRPRGRRLLSPIVPRSIALLS